MPPSPVPLALALGSAWAARPPDYPILADLDFAVVEHVGETRLYRPAETTYTEAFVEAELDRIRARLRRYAEAYDLPLESCRDTLVDLYVVDLEVINDRKRYPRVSHDVPERWALYDPNSARPRRPAIVLTDTPDYRMDAVLLAHEFAHYVYDVCDWSRSTTLDTEEIADEFHQAYGMWRFGRVYSD